MSNIPTATRSGKVRDIYDLGKDELLMVTSDRLSAHDVVFVEPVACKGRVLTAMSNYWFRGPLSQYPNHLISTDHRRLFFVGIYRRLYPFAMGRSMLVRRAEMLPVECIVRGNISGSGWKDYLKTGEISGIKLPPGLLESAKFDEPIFTPSTKAASGHDVNISFDEMVALIGRKVSERARTMCLEAFNIGAAHAAKCGIIIADTKFELGFIDGELAFCDEVLTPDSSRFWPADQVVMGQTPPSFDKQPVRDWSEETGWNKKPPAPPLPYEVAAETTMRYIDAYRKITGLNFWDWPGASL